MKKIYIVLFLLIFLIQPSGFVSAEERLQINAPKINIQPKLDGVITKEEWGEPIAVFSKDSDKVRFASGMADAERLPTDVQLYVMWDDVYLCIGAVVTSTSHQNNKRDAYIWEEDSLFLGISMAENQAAVYRFIFALGGGNIPLGYLLNLPNETLDGIDTAVQYLLSYHEYYVGRANGRTTYEVKLRWNDYTVDERKIKTGFQFYLNLELHTKGYTAGKPRKMMYGTYDDEFINWQYPQIILGEQKIAQIPTPTPSTATTPAPTLKSTATPVLTPTSAPTITLSPTETSTKTPTLSPSIKIPSTFSTSSITNLPIHSPDKTFGTSPGWYFLTLIPLSAIVATVFYIKKKRK